MVRTTVMSSGGTCNRRWRRLQPQVAQAAVWPCTPRPSLPMLPTAAAPCSLLEYWHPPHCDRTATALRPRCNRAATALQPRCNRAATALQRHLPRARLHPCGLARQALQARARG